MLDSLSESGLQGQIEEAARLLKSSSPGQAAQFAGSVFKYLAVNLCAHLQLADAAAQDFQESEEVPPFFGFFFRSSIDEDDFLIAIMQAASKGRQESGSGPQAHHPRDLCCPISFELMSDPVFTSDGHTYDRASIEGWFRLGHQRSPLTNLPITRLLTPNHGLKARILEYRQQLEDSVSFRGP